MKPVIYTSDNIKEKLENMVSEFNDHVAYHSPIWRRSENAYRSNFYKRYADNILNNRRLELDTNTKEWLCEAEMNHSFSFVRLLHSTLISNEPVVTASPANDSQGARDAASAADTLIRYSKQEYKVKENVDQFILRTFIYGLGCLRVDWNSNLGEIVSYDEKTEEILFRGDNEIRIIEPYNFYLFSNSNNLQDCYGYLEKLYVDIEEAKSIWPDFADKFVAISSDSNEAYNSEKKARKKKDNKVVIWEYIEIGRPINANLGRHILFTDDFTVLVLEDNPHKHKKLPIVILPDIIIPNRLFPVSLMEMLNSPQKQLNDLMSRVLENVKLYTKIFITVDRNANLNEDALTDIPTIPIMYNGSEGRPPAQMNPPQMGAFVYETYKVLVEMMQQIAGVRDFSRGVMAKAVSGFAANLMIEADSKVQIQLHERYKIAIKNLFELLLSDIQEKWTESRTIKVLNEEDEVEEKAFKGADLQGGYVVTTDFGSTLPIDPAARRQMIQEIGTMAQQWGIKIDGNKFFEMLRLGDVMGTFNASEAAAKVQRKERIDMIKTSKLLPVDYIADDHISHYVEMYGFFQTNEYNKLSGSQKALLKEHANTHIMADAFKKAGATEEQFNNKEMPAPPMPPQDAQNGGSIPSSPTNSQAGQEPQPM